MTGRSRSSIPFTDRLSDPAQVEGPLNGLAGYDTVWLVQSHHQELDPGNLVADWFSARYPLATEVFPAGIAVRAFAQQYRQTEAAGDQGVSLAADQLRLLRCDYAPSALSAREDIFHPPSNWVHVTTSWQVGDQSSQRRSFPQGAAD